MSHYSALLFDFNDTQSAELACETLKELGYESVLHDGSRMHVHLEGCDLTSALEIVEAHGGQLAEQSSIAQGPLMDSAYSLDAIAIPAHFVNEEWGAEENGGDEADGLHNRDEDADYRGEFLPDPGTYDHFSGDVHI